MFVQILLMKLKESKELVFTIIGARLKKLIRICFYSWL